MEICFGRVGASFAWLNYGIETTVTQIEPKQARANG